MRLLRFGAVMGLLISTIACSGGPGLAGRPSAASTADANPGDPVTVSAAAAQQRDLTDRLTLTGTITPYEQVTLYAKATGYLKYLKVDIGDRVKAGQLLAELDVPEMATAVAEKRAAVLKAEAAVDQARAAVEQSQAELEFADINHKRLKAIRDRDADVLPQQDVDQARASDGVARAKLKSAETQVKVAEAALAGAKADLETLEALIQYSRIESPMSGVVTQRFVDPGALIQVASASRTQAAPVVAIARLDRLRVMVDVPEPNVTHVHPGTPVTLAVASLPGEPFPARVTRVGTVLDPASRTMRAEVDVVNPGERLRPGMTVKVSLDTKRTPNAVTVPASAVHSQGAARTVFVVKGGMAELVKVKTGIEAPEWVQIVEGIRPGDQVIVAAAAELKDGVPVKVRQ
jgi:RND family efflux transporter MFP subunit